MAVACKSAKNYYNPSTPPPKFVPVSHQRSRYMKFSRSSEHKLKAFADYLALISSDKEEHHTALKQLDDHALDLDLELRADKCYSLSIVSRKCVTDYTITLRSGHKALSSAGTKFLGSFVADTWKSTLSGASSALVQSFNSLPETLDLVSVGSISYGFTNTTLPHHLTSI